MFDTLNGHFMGVMGFYKRDFATVAAAFDSLDQFLDGNNRLWYYGKARQHMAEAKAFGTRLADTLLAVKQDFAILCLLTAGSKILTGLPGIIRDLPLFKDPKKIDLSNITQSMDMPAGRAVSYTHLTLPTLYSV